MSIFSILGKNVGVFLLQPAVVSGYLPSCSGEPVWLLPVVKLFVVVVVLLVGKALKLLMMSFQHSLVGIPLSLKLVMMSELLRILGNPFYPVSLLMR